MSEFGYFTIDQHETIIKEIISEFVESWDKLRDFVLDAPILSNDAYDYRNYLHKIKDYVKLEKEKWEESK